MGLVFFSILVGKSKNIFLLGWGQLCARGNILREGAGTLIQNRNTFPGLKVKENHIGSAVSKILYYKQTKEMR